MRDEKGRFIKGSIIGKEHRFKKGYRGGVDFPKGHEPWNKGKQLSEELKLKLSLAHIGNHHTEESKLKIGLAKKGENNFNWKGGRYKSRGYVLILKPDHPYSNKQGYVYEHHLVMEKALNRYLLPTEIVHHINGIKDDNRIENLMLFKNHSEHKKHHLLLQKVS
jgi:hypothetical protein